MSTSSSGADEQAEAPRDPTFNPFPFGAPAPGSPVATAFPELFPAPQPPGQGGPYAASPEQYGGWSGPNPGPTGQHSPYSTPQLGPYAGAPEGYGQYSSPLGHQVGQPAGYPGWTPTAGTPGTSNGRAVAGLILGILSLALFFFTVLDVPLIVLGIIFSSLGLAAAKRGEGRRAMALAGLICSLIAALVVAATTVFVLHRVRICDRSYDRGTSQYSSCITDFG